MSTISAHELAEQMAFNMIDAEDAAAAEESPEAALARKATEKLATRKPRRR